MMIKLSCNIHVYCKLMIISIAIDIVAGLREYQLVKGRWGARACGMVVLNNKNVKPSAWFRIRGRRVATSNMETMRDMNQVLRCASYSLRIQNRD